MPPGVREIKGVQYAKVGGVALLMDIFVPTGDKHPAIELIHGGGYSHGTRGFMRPLSIFLSSNGYVAFEIDYGLAPQFHYPAQVEDAQKAIDFIRTHAGQYGVDGRRLGVFGTSAGGTIAASLATEGKGPLERGSRVAAAATWSAPLDFRPLIGPLGLTAFKLDDYIFGKPETDPQAGASQIVAASPISHVSCDDPPSFIANAHRDLVPLAQAEGYLAKLQGAGVPHESLFPPRGHALSYAPIAKPPTLMFFDRYLKGALDVSGSCVAASPAPTTSSPTTGATPATHHGSSLIYVIVAAGAILVIALLVMTARSRRRRL